VLTGILAGETPEELIAGSRHAASEGAQGIAISLAHLRPEHRNCEALSTVFEAVNLPFMVYFYRHDPWQGLEDEPRQQLLLAAASAGAAMIDVMGDLYDPSPLEITHNDAAIGRQQQLIAEIHRRGARVVMSSHMPCARTAEQVLHHLQELKSRGPDVVKIVTGVNTPQELAEAVRTTLLLREELKSPFIHLCDGTFSRPHRFLCPAIGTSIVFGVSHSEPRYGFKQPTLRALNGVLDYMHWHIDQVA